MRSIITKLVVVLIVAAAWQPAHASEPVRTLLVLGDSLSAGFGVEPGEAWVTLLQNRLKAKGYGYRVVNASISGDTTTGGLNRLPRALQIHRPSIVLIELGGNDGLRATPISLIRDNMAKLITTAQAAGAKVVLAGLQMPPNYGARYTADFAALYPELAKKYEVGLIPFILDGIALNGRLMQPDGIHPNTEAQPVLLDNAWPAIEKAINARDLPAYRNAPM